MYAYNTAPACNRSFRRVLRACAPGLGIVRQGWLSMNKIILADNQAIFRAGTAKVLTMEDDFRIIAQCGDGERLYQVLEAFRGATLLFASALKLNINQLVERVRVQSSLCIVIAENSESTSSYLSAGVHGAAHRSVTGPALIDCARRVARGERGVKVAGCGSRHTGRRSGGGARPRSSHAQGNEDCRAHCSRLQEQGNRHAPDYDRASHQELSTQHL